MAWDDAPPAATEIQSAPTPGSGWDAAPPSKDEIGFSASDVARNAVSDVGGMVKGGLRVAKTLVDPLNLTESAMAGSLDPTKKLITGAPAAIAAMPGKIYDAAKETVTHPITTFEKHPVNTALNVLGAADLGMGAAGLMSEAGAAGEAGDAANVAGPAGAAPAGGLADAGRLAEGAPKPIELPPEAADILKTAPTGAPGAAPGAPAAESVPLGATFQETVGNLGKRVPADVKAPLQQVGEYLSQKYGQMAKKPGLADTIANYAEENARNMATKAAGASYGQLRKIGEPEMHQLQDLMLERGIISPKVGPLGARKMVEDFHQQAGETIGRFRDAAAERGGVHDVDQLVGQIRSNLDQKYLQGMYSGQKGSYAKALAELKKLDGTPNATADKITELFKEARRQDPLREPSGPLADVARQLRSANEQVIKKTLTPEEGQAYDKALNEYGAMTQIREFMKRRNLRDASGRLGPGAGPVRQAIQSFFDSIGYRGQAQISKKFAEWIRKNPQAAQSPKAMLQHYVDEASQAVDDVTGAP